jgi:TatD DNase family protein
MDMSRHEDGGYAQSGKDDFQSVQAMLADAAEAGVSRVVQVGCDLPDLQWTVDAAERFASVVATVALHPNAAAELAASAKLADALSEVDRIAGSSSRVRGIGETGLDFFRTGPEGHLAQEESFRAHIEIARSRDLALTIHDRDAHADVMRILDDARLPERVVFHCFSGDVDMARWCVERGFFLSFAGTVTFKNAAGLRNALTATTLENVLVETDAPFLTPHPYRGRPNASYLMPLTVRTIADVLSRDLGDVCEALQTNSDRAFGPW